MFKGKQRLNFTLHLAIDLKIIFGSLLKDLWIVMQSSCLYHKMSVKFHMAKDQYNLILQLVLQQFTLLQSSLLWFSLKWVNMIAVYMKELYLVWISDYHTALNITKISPILWTILKYCLTTDFFNCSVFHMINFFAVHLTAVHITVV